MTKLDTALILEKKRKPLKGAMDLPTRVALNLFWRKKSAKERGPIPVRAITLAKAFNISPNTLYYQCLTGDAESYAPFRRGFNAAREVNELIDHLGPDQAWAKYVTPKMIEAVNAQLRAEK